MIILGPKTAILGPQFCRNLVLGPQFWWSGAPPWIRPCRIRSRAGTKFIFTQWWIQSMTLWNFHTFLKNDAWI